MSAPETAVVVPVEPQQTDAPAAPAVSADQPQNILAVISQLAANPNVDPGVVDKWLAMYERLDARRRQQAYTEALTRIHARMPQIERHGVIPLREGKGIKYAKLEDIDRTIREMLAEEGLAFSFGSHSDDGKLFDITATLTHREGHSEKFNIQLPLDPGPQTGPLRRSPPQAVSATLSTARRQLIKMALNIVEKGEDVDGADLEKISGEQLKDLGSLLDEVGCGEKSFFKFMDVGKLDQILVRDYQKAITALEQKRRRGK